MSTGKIQLFQSFPQVLALFRHDNKWFMKATLVFDSLLFINHLVPDNCSNGIWFIVFLNSCTNPGAGWDQNSAFDN